MKISPQLVVHERDPLKQGLLIALLVFVLVGAGFLIYDYGHSRADYDYDSLQNQNIALQDQIVGLISDIEKVRDDLVSSQSSRKTDKVAYAEVEVSLRNLQAEILELKEEVAFYRSIVAPRESARGLRIQRFNVSSSGKKGFRYKLVLTQVIKNSRITRGNITMQVEGVRNGKSVKINLTSLSAKGQKKLDFRFKYFQSFEDDLILPDDFLPSRVHVKVVSNRVTLEKTFSWPDSKHSGSLKTSAL